METSTIRIAIRKLPDQFDRSRISVVLDEIECALMDDGGVYVRAYADSMTITIEVPTNQLIDAAAETGDDGRQHFIYEAGDLLYHTMVLLAWRGVDLQEIAQELARREGTSGLVEKANRGADSDSISSSSESE